MRPLPAAGRGDLAVVQVAHDRLDRLAAGHAGDDVLDYRGGYRVGLLPDQLARDRVVTARVTVGREPVGAAGRGAVGHVADGALRGQLRLVCGGDAVFGERLPVPPDLHVVGALVTGHVDEDAVLAAGVQEPGPRLQLPAAAARLPQHDHIQVAALSRTGTPTGWGPGTRGPPSSPSPRRRAGWPRSAARCCGRACRGRG